MKMINALIIFIVFFSSCNKNCPEQGEIVDEGAIIKEALVEIDYSSATEQEYLIRSSNENVVEARVKIGEQASFDTINFNDFSLLGKQITFKSGGIIKERAVSIDNQNKLVNCSIEIKSCGKDKVGLSKHTWMLTNKIPADYKVVFDVVDKSINN